MMENNPRGNPWKVIAIIFIILFVLVTAAFSYLVWLGDSIMKAEQTCKIDVCFNMDEATSYEFDSYDNMCYCFNDKAEIIHSQYIR